MPAWPASDHAPLHLCTIREQENRPQLKSCASRQARGFKFPSLVLKPSWGLPCGGQPLPCFCPPPLPSRGEERAALPRVFSPAWSWHAEAERERHLNLPSSPPELASLELGCGHPPPNRASSKRRKKTLNSFPSRLSLSASGLSRGQGPGRGYPTPLPTDLGCGPVQPGRGLNPLPPYLSM